MMSGRSPVASIRFTRVLYSSAVATNFQSRLMLNRSGIRLGPVAAGDLIHVAVACAVGRHDGYGDRLVILHEGLTNREVNAAFRDLRWRHMAQKHGTSPEPEIPTFSTGNLLLYQANRSAPTLKRKPAAYIHKKNKYIPASFQQKNRRKSTREENPKFRLTPVSNKYRIVEGASIRSFFRERRRSLSCVLCACLIA